MLDDCGVSHGKSGEKETHGDSCDRPERDAKSSEEWVYQAVEDGNEDDDSDRIKVEDQIVGNSMKLHGTSCADRCQRMAVDFEMLKRGA